MAISRNHTIVPTRDQSVCAAFLADIPGMPVGEPLRPFVSVSVSSVSLDDAHIDVAGSSVTEVVEHHYEFEVDEETFERVVVAGLRYYAEPHEPTDSARSTPLAATAPSPSTTPTVTSRK